MIPRRHHIAVFGSSEPVPGDPLYEGARRVGRLLAEAGYDVVTGGYGGVMEGASRGAAESGARALGVTCALFSAREPNPYLTERLDTVDLLERTGVLVESASGFVVLHGKSGTLAELAFLWALHRAGSLGSRRVVLLGGDWRPFLHHLVRGGMIEDAQLAITRVVDTPEEAVGEIDRSIVAEDGFGK
jgi:uncharacterized protein (TIGR00730 family)